MNLDLDVERARRRAERDEEPPVVVLKDKMYTLADELPLLTVTNLKKLRDATRRNDGDGIVRALTASMRALFGSK